MINGQQVRLPWLLAHLSLYSNGSRSEGCTPGSFSLRFMTFKYQLVSFSSFASSSPSSTFQPWIHFVSSFIRPILRACPPTLLSSIAQSFTSRLQIVHLSFSLSLFCPPHYSTSSSLFRPPTGIHLYCIRPRYAEGGHQPRKTQKMDRVWALHDNGELSKRSFALHLKKTRTHTHLSLFIDQTLRGSSIKI